MPRYPSPLPQCTVAAIQMVSSCHLETNLSQAANLIAQAAHQSAQLVVLPENFSLMGKTPADTFAIAEYAGHGKIQDFIAEQARLHQLWIVAGTIALKANTQPERVYAATLVYDSNGKCVGRYNKIHLFDVTAASGEHYHESETIKAGQEIVSVNTPFGKMGLAICYDLRFPELFRQMIEHHADFFCVPAAFTYTTGQAHWEALIRCRAIENLSCIIAANQGGQHENGRRTYGHSMIVDCWGQILQQQQEKEGVVIATLDLIAQNKQRLQFPALSHRKIF